MRSPAERAERERLVREAAVSDAGIPSDAVRTGADSAPPCRAALAGELRRARSIHFQKKSCRTVPQDLAKFDKTVGKLVAHLDALVAPQ